MDPTNYSHFDIGTIYYFNQMVNQNVPHLPPQLIICNSNNATTINSTGSYATFKLVRTTIIPGNVRCYCKLNHFKYSNLFYNITPSSCNLYFTLSGTPFVTNSIYITPGNYNITSLLSLLSTPLAAYGLTLEYDPITFRCTISHLSQTVTIKDGSSSIHRKLGFTVNNTPALSYTGEDAIRLGGTQQVVLQINSFLLNSNSTAGYKDNVLASIPNSVLIGNTNTYTGDNISLVGSNEIDMITLTLSDETGELLDFHGSSWELSLNLTFSYEFEYIEAKNLLSDSDKLNTT